MQQAWKLARDQKVSLPIIDTEGKVRYESGLGPYGLSPEDLEKAIELYLGGS